MNNLVVVLGPTSTGKTSLTLDLCAKYNGCIVSADSRQIYKYMDIGTGKTPVSGDYSVVKESTKWIINGVDVWGYDLVLPDKDYSAYDFTQYALDKIRNLQKEGKSIFLVGGTGFYIESLLGEKILSDVLPDPELRKHLNEFKTEELSDQLKSLNPLVYAKTDLKNRVRLIRAIERERSSTGKKPKIHYLEDTKIIKLGLRSENDYLFRRADNWVEEIWHEGLLDEVKNLIDLGYENTPRMNALIYTTAISYIHGDLNETDSIERIKFDIHAYIRRQLTWFNKSSAVNWYDISDTNYKQKVYNFIGTEI